MGLGQYLAGPSQPIAPARAYSPPVIEALHLACRPVLSTPDPRYSLCRGLVHRRVDPFGMSLTTRHSQPEPRSKGRLCHTGCLFQFLICSEFSFWRCCSYFTLQVEMLYLIKHIGRIKPEAQVSAQLSLENHRK